MMMGLCFLLPSRVHTRSKYPSKRAHAIVTIPRIVVVQRAGSVDIARIAGVGSYKAHPYINKGIISLYPSFSMPLSYT